MKGKSKNLLWIFVITVFLIVLALASNFSFKTKEVASAQSVTYENSENSNQSSRGIFTSLSISINGGNGKVWTTVKNDITIFPSTVIVVVELYSSLTYTDNYEKMELVSVNSINDLDMGKTISTEAPTGGVDKYWIGRMRYRIDNDNWKSKDTGVCKISAAGDFLGYV